MVSTGRPPGHDTPVALARRCSGCGVEPRTVTEVQDLEVLWLVDGLGDTPAPARYCAACRPGGPVTDHACELCGDGPLLAGRFAALDDLLTCAAVESWLFESGWRNAGRWCPQCAPVMNRRPSSAARPGSTGTDAARR